MLPLTKTQTGKIPALSLLLKYNWRNLKAVKGKVNCVCNNMSGEKVLFRHPFTDWNSDSRKDRADVSLENYCCGKPFSFYCRLFR